VWHTDNGSEFVNETAEMLMDILHVDVRHGKPRKPSTQGSVERFNHTLELMLGKDGWRDDGTPLGSANRRWVDRLDRVVFSYNSRFHRAIQRSPFEVMFGRPPFLSAASSSSSAAPLDMEESAHNDPASAVSLCSSSSGAGSSHPAEFAVATKVPHDGTDAERGESDRDTEENEDTRSAADTGSVERDSSAEVPPGIRAFFEARDSILGAARVQQTRYETQILAKSKRMTRTKRDSFNVGDSVLERVYGDHNPATKRQRFCPAYGLRGTVSAPRRLSYEDGSSSLLLVRDAVTGKDSFVSVANAKKGKKKA
jgi:hypothetical protein